MALSRVIYTAQTGTGPFSYSAVDLLTDALVTEESQLVVTVNDVEIDYTANAPAPGEYTLNKTTRQVTLGTALIATDDLVIQRVTQMNALHVVFQNNAPLGEDDLNLVLKQLMFIAQEAKEL